VDVAEGAAHVIAWSGGEIPDRSGRRKHQSHRTGQPFDPLAVGELGHAPAQLLVLSGERRRLLERPTHARPQLQDLDLSRHDPGQEDAEQRNPRPPANDPVKPGMVGQGSGERRDPASQPDRQLARPFAVDRAGRAAAPDRRLRSALPSERRMQRHGDRGGSGSRGGPWRNRCRTGTG